MDNNSRFNRRRRVSGMIADLFFLSLIGANIYNIYQDQEYWKQSPEPLYIFLILQLILKILLIRVPMTHLRPKTMDIIIIALIFCLLGSTISGLVWFIKIKNEDAEFLTTQYMTQTILLLAIPILVAILFLVILCVGICLFILDMRRRNRFRRFQDDEEVFDQQQIEVIVETYMQMLDYQQYNKVEAKYNDCAICLKDFEQGESLSQIPNCEHIFHESCLRKWFRQLQICPMCRGNIIKMPGERRSNLQNNHDQSIRRLEDARQSNLRVEQIQQQVNQNSMIEQQEQQNLRLSQQEIQQNQESQEERIRSVIVSDAQNLPVQQNNQHE
ncbi:ring finger protein [Stylonychia lemnae]|uniref:Ring finger protein n=1 Tax=Stylonychia lemnae TaxID=5949 RepID=A0A078ATF0_STYLE|nr:ring finger protein [Stylonychia lemnae]|eukprot:CDW85286.1 ring finger protein [Stylonychia lemnae]